MAIVVRRTTVAAVALAAAASVAGHWKQQEEIHHLGRAWEDLYTGNDQLRSELSEARYRRQVLGTLALHLNYVCENSLAPVRWDTLCPGPGDVFGRELKAFKDTLDLEDLEHLGTPKWKQSSACLTARSDGRTTE